MQLTRPSAQIWESIKPLVESACLSSKGRFNAEDVKRWLDDGTWQLWAVEDEGIKAICTTEIINYPGLKVCRVNIVTGKGRHDWQHFRFLIEEWARSQGCKRIEALARKGWARVFTEYEMTHVFIEKEL